MVVRSRDVKPIPLRFKSAADIDEVVSRVLRELGNPEPPLKLADVRKHLRLAVGSYKIGDDSGLRLVADGMLVGDKQMLSQPTLLGEAIRQLDLRAVYLPDSRQIFLDEDLPRPKKRWTEAHEIGHSIIPWHPGMMLGDTSITLSLDCHRVMEAEANYAAGRLLFLGDRFAEEARASPPSLTSAIALAERYGNTMTSSLWRYVEQAAVDRPIVALISDHPHPSRRGPDSGVKSPSRYCIESSAFVQQFGARNNEALLFEKVISYCNARRGGSLGGARIVLVDVDGLSHEFQFETFFNGHQALTMGVWSRARRGWSAVGSRDNRSLLRAG
ncbi:MAG: hypothetical protein JWM95_1562 [Gemmatimonadetes bacterium]|nr:hypothetical protein [Gemmatimonadota bacterium]